MRKRTPKRSLMTSGAVKVTPVARESQAITKISTARFQTSLTKETHGSLCLRRRNKRGSGSRRHLARPVIAKISLRLRKRKMLRKS